MAATMLESTNSTKTGLAALPALWQLYERMDRMRIRQGEWLQVMGWGPQERVSRVVLNRPAFTLKAYAAPEQKGPVVLLVPAPIKRAYIWDLAPGASVVQACLDQGLRPYLVQWETPTAEYDLADYADRFLAECAQAVRGECGAVRLILAGHSLGGILTAIFSALHPDLVAGLIILGSPLHFTFDPQAGALGPVIESTLSGRLLEKLPTTMPGSLMSQAGFMASPLAFGRERWQDWLRSLPEAEAVRLHMQVARWSLDELPLARRLIEDLVRHLYVTDGLIQGQLSLGGRQVAASAIDTPLLMVIDEQCPVVPPAAMLPFYQAVASTDKRLLSYDGDVGVAIRHIGPLVGRQAHARLWPEILDWARNIQPA